MTDAAARERIERDLATTLMVEAAAGTGKTTMLVRRFVALLRQGADVGSLAALTFTDKAAGELKVRIRGVVESERRRAGDAERAALTRALARLEEAKVSTIHTFAADLLRERPIEAGVDPAFVPMSEDEASLAFDEAFGRWLEDALGRGKAPIVRALARKEIGVDRLRRAARELVGHRSMTTPWRAQPFDLRAALEGTLAALHALAGLVGRSSSGSDPLRKDLWPVVALADRVHRLPEDELEAELVALAKTRDVMKPRAGRGGYAPGITREEVRSAHADFAEAVGALQQGADADLATQLRGELWSVVERYEAIKASRGILDFDDLLERTRSLVAGDPEVRRRFAGRLTHVLVDEFQDTDPAQAAILLLLTSDRPNEADPLASLPAPGKLFVVGDPKQSIYRFRHADIATYVHIKSLVLASGGAVLQLSRSFRSVPSIQAFVNAAFSAAFDGDATSLQAEHVALERAREDIDGQPAVLGVPVPQPYGSSGKPAKYALRASYPTALAGFIEWLVRESPYKVRRHDGALEPVTPGDVCVLFRQVGGFGESAVRELTGALSQRGIPFAVVGSASTLELDEIRGVVSALRAVEHPGDALVVYAALKGFLFGISDELLLEYKTRYGAFDALARPRTALPQDLVPVGHALALLGGLHLRRNVRPPAETLFELLAATRGHLTLALSPSAEQAMTDLASLAQRAVKHERRGGLSYRAFIDDLVDSAAPAAASEWDVHGKGVRIMTAHRAKGLEFPVVAIGDPASPGSRSPDKVVSVREKLAALELAGLAPWELIERADIEAKRLDAEAVRLAYVAATRARDLLLLPFVGDDVRFPEDGWVAPLTRALSPTSPRAPLRKEPWVKGDDTVIRDQVGSAEPSARTIAPGVHAMPWGEAAFFDPRALPEKPTTKGVVGEELLAEGAPEATVRADEARLATIRASRASAVAAASVPSLAVQTVTARAHALGQVGRPPVAVEKVPRAGARPGGARFGTLVHQLLASGPLDLEASQAEKLAVALGALLGATADEIEAAARAAIAASAHPLLVRARAARERGGLRREVPVVLFVDERSVVDGVVDLAFEEDGAWVVVDYKTDDPDRIGDERLAAYARQVDLYREAITRTTGRPASAALFFV
ncbi:MAG: UvrD-helicase domain-containing protein [Myxococcales bacterium]|nr:UvrD-helicase domain-containing protein [Myxococcales bacterium]